MWNVCNFVFVRFVPRREATKMRGKFEIQNPCFKSPPHSQQSTKKKSVSIKFSIISPILYLIFPIERKCFKCISTLFIIEKSIPFTSLWHIALKGARESIQFSFYIIYFFIILKIHVLLPFVFYWIFFLSFVFGKTEFSECFVVLFWMDFWSGNLCCWVTLFPPMCCRR